MIVSGTPGFMGSNPAVVLTGSKKGKEILKEELKNQGKKDDMIDKILVGKLKKVIGEIKDSDILGTWDCTSYKPSSASDSSYQVENGGNGQVGNGYFESRAGILTLSEQDEEDSLNSPKNYLMDTADVLNVLIFLFVPLQ